MVSATYMDGQTVDCGPEQTARVWREIHLPHLIPSTP